MKKTVWQSRQALNGDYEIFHYYDTYIKEVKLHHHDFFEVYYFAGGEAEYTIEGRTYKLISGDILLISPNELHQVDVPKSLPYERFVLWISERYLDTLSTPVTNLKTVFERAKVLGNLIRLEQSESAQILSLLEQLSLYSAESSFGSDLLLNARICELFIRLTMKMDNQQFDQSTTGGFIEKVIRYINENLSDPQLCVEQIAQNAFVSPSRLSHIFKEKTNSSLYQYIIKKRLVGAKELLRQKERVTDVYGQCGFSDYTVFIRAFKREYGLTPKQYAQLYKD